MLDMSSKFKRRTFKGPHKIKSSQQVLRKISLYIVLSFISLFLLTSLVSVLQEQLNVSSNTLKKWTTHISTEAFLGAISMEITPLQRHIKSEGIEVPNASHLVIEMMTTLNPEDPRTLLRRELPGFAFFDGEVIVAGEGTSYLDIGSESAPPLDVVMAQREAIANDTNNENRDSEDSALEPPELTTGDRKVVFIYHTHNRESWLPHIEGSEVPDDAFHPEVNITKVGKYLGEQLEKRGIGTYVDTTDITDLLHASGLPYGHSYAKSRQIIEATVNENEDITFMFDLHRDAALRDRTAYEADGKVFARPMFVIGQRNPNYEKNVQFAEQFHEMIEERYPGLSRGIISREHTDYNQSISGNNILIEIGGVENTLEESYRTAELLADIIADIYWQAEKVDAQPQD